MRTHQSSTRQLIAIVIACILAAAAHAPSQTASAAQSSLSGGSYKISGAVINKVTSSPLALARISIADAKNSANSASVITSENGKFEFSGVPAGKYSLTGEKRGFITAAYDQHEEFSTAIVTGAGLDTESLTLRLASNAVIAGKVLDEAGEPVRHATIALYHDDHSSGVDQIRHIRGTVTDDQGAYEITSLRPGTYFVSASAAPWYAIHPSSRGENQRPSQEPSAADRSLDVAYPLTFYADVTDSDDATPIPIRGGDHLEVDIHLNPVPALRLLFHVSGDRQHGFAHPSFQQPVFDSSLAVTSSGERMLSRGLLEVTGVPAGRYNIDLNGQETALQMNAVDLTRDGQEIDTSHAEALSTVKISAQVQGEATLPQNLAVGFRSGNRNSPGTRMLDPKGEVEYQQIPPGPYEVIVRGPAPYSVAHMTVDGSQVTGHTLTVTPGSSLIVSVTLVGGSINVEGTVKKAGQSFGGAMVVLVPANPENNRDLFRRDQSDLDGSFTLRGVIPGSYTLLAIENGWDLEWSQPSVIAAYLKRGRKIEVGERAGRAVTVSEAIEVQSE
jgi:hypothetical protein